MQLILRKTGAGKISAVLCCLAVVSCGDGNSPDGEAGGEQLATDAPFDGLRVVGDKDKFATRIREALLNTISTNGSNDGNLGTDGASTDGSTTAGSTTAGSSSPEADGLQESPTAASDNNSSAVADSGGLDVTGTNVQEIGVDESDRVKSDGKHLFVLSNTFGGAIPVDAQPAEPAITQRLSLPYQPEDAKASIRMLSLDAESADAALIREMEIDTQREQARGLYLHSKGDKQSLIVTSSSLSGYWGYWNEPYLWAGQTSTIRKIDVTDPATASVADSLKIDGQIVSSRRVGDYLYVASRFFPKLKDLDYGSSDTQTLTDAVNSTDIALLLPQATRASDAQIQALADANNCFVTEKPQSGYYSPDIVTLAVIDIATLAVSDSVCYLGASETLYASPNSIYLATTDWQYSFTVDDIAIEPALVDGPGTPIGPVSPVTDPRTETDIHQFDIDGGKLTYRGSGRIEGHLGWNELRKPFRMSERDGYLRVVSYDDNQDGSQSPVLLSVLRPVENGARLELIARLPNDQRPEHIGKPREQLYASRFLGDRAYLVTFRQTDPLYVVDLTNPSSPFIAGELEIDGYSDYLGPVGEAHLLGIGKGAIPANNPWEGERGAFATGVKLSLFDVSNPSSPKEVQSIEIGKRGSESGALRDHHGITLQAATNEHPARLTFGIDVADGQPLYNDGPGTWYEWRESGLFAFEIKTDANAGISQQGSIIVESRSDTQQYGPTQYGGDRSVIVNDAVFYIHGNRVYGANWGSLGNFSGPR